MRSSQWGPSGSRESESAAAEAERLAADAARAPKRGDDIARKFKEEFAAEARAAEAADPRVAPLPDDSDDELD